MRAGLDEDYEKNESRFSTEFLLIYKKPPPHALTFSVLILQLKRECLLTDAEKNLRYIEMTEEEERKAGASHSDGVCYGGINRWLD